MGTPRISKLGVVGLAWAGTGCTLDTQANGIPGVNGLAFTCGLHTVVGGRYGKLGSARACSPT